MNFLIIFSAKYLFIVVGIIALLVFMLASQQTKTQLIRLSVFAFPLAYLLGLLLNSVILSPRPFVVEHIQPLIQASTDNGFPSDHTLLAMTIACVIFAVNRKVGSFLSLLALCVGIARVLAHVHHGVDVAGSVVIAATATAFADKFLVKRFPVKVPGWLSSEHAVGTIRR